MAKLNVEQQVEGLQAYYLSLRQLDPRDDERHEAADPAFFYGSGDISVTSALADAKRSVRENIAMLGRAAYGGLAMGAMDLREDNDVLRSWRSDVLALLTGPTTKEIRAERASKIGGVLADILSGQPIVVTEYDKFHRDFKPPQEVTVDTDRPLYGVFRNSHISSTVLTIQYDRPDTYLSVDYGPEALSFDVPSLFDSKGVTIKPAAVAV
jgi:hypothetical protein